MGTTPFRYRHPSIQPPNSNSLSEGKQREGERGAHQRRGRGKLCPTHPPKINLPPLTDINRHTTDGHEHGNAHAVHVPPYHSFTSQKDRSQLNETVTISSKPGKTILPFNSGCTLHHHRDTTSFLSVLPGFLPSSRKLPLPLLLSSPPPLSSVFLAFLFLFIALLPPFLLAASF